MTINIKEIASSYAPIDVIAKLGLDGEKRGERFFALNPTRDDTSLGSFYIDLQTGYWTDKATGDWGGDIVSLWAYIRGTNSQFNAAAELRNTMLGREVATPIVAVDRKRKLGEIVMPAIVNANQRVSLPKWHNDDLPGDPTAVFNYNGIDGVSLLGIVCRWDLPGKKKEFRQRFMFRSESGHLSWRWAGPSGSDPHPLYRLERLRIKPRRVWIVEGEQTCDDAQEFAPEHTVVLSWLGGSSQAQNVDVGHLRGIECILIPDRDCLYDKLGEVLPYKDQPSVKAMHIMARKLQELGCRVSIVDYKLGADKHGWDLSDAKQEGWTSEQVQSMIAAGARQLPSIKKEAEPVDPRFGIADLYTPIPMNAWHGTDTKNKPWDSWLSYQDMFRAYGIICRENELTQTIEMLHKKSDRLLMHEEVVTLASYNSLSKAHWKEHFRVIASKDSYHPVVEWIKSKPWDGTTRIPDVFGTLTLGDSDPELSFKLFFRWCISAVALVTQERMDVNNASPAAQGVLVLVGAQNITKSRWLLSLAPNWAVKTGAALHVDDKDELIKLTTAWLVEIAELSGSWGSSRQKQDRTKAFLTGNTEEIRKPYAPAPVIRPRRTVYIGTQNQDDFLEDDTGSRRWWTIRVAGMHVEHGIDIQQFWAEIYSIFAAGEPWWLVGDERERLAASNEKHRVTSSIESILDGMLDWDSRVRRAETAGSILMQLGIKATDRQCQQAIVHLAHRGCCVTRRSGRSALVEVPPLR